MFACSGAWAIGTRHVLRRRFPTEERGLLRVTALFWTHLAGLPRRCRDGDDGFLARCRFRNGPQPGPFFLDEGRSRNE
ncbi:MAG TPA: hypothetical protein D7I09_02505, partial [Candidatus Poseidoniales archaeon]